MAIVAQTVKKESRCKKHAPDVVKPTDNTLARIGQEDAELLLRAIGEPAEYVDHTMFHRRGAEKTLFGEQTDSLGQNSEPFVPVSAFLVDPDLDGIGHVSMPTLTRQQEQLLFQQYNFARWKVYEALKKHKGKRLKLAEIQSLVMWFKLANASRTRIVQTNMPLVLAMAKRTKLMSVDFSDVISEGNMALLRSVEKFDCSRGFKLSTYACQAILKSFSRVAIRSSRYHRRFPIEFDPAMETSDFLEKKRQEVEDNCVHELRSALADNLAELTDVEKKVIVARFALDAVDPEQVRPMTLEQIGNIIGVTKERVRQIQNIALEKLRQILEDGILAA